MTPSTENPKARILAVDVRPSRLGFAAFETPAKMLSFGVCTIPSRQKTQERLVELIMRIKPSVMVLRKLASQSKRNRLDHTSIVRVLRDEASSSSVLVEFIPEAALKAFFRGLGQRNKYDVAALLALWFPDLAWKLPTERKLYKPEPWTMAIFDAVAIGTVYLKSRGLLNIEGKAL